MSPALRVGIDIAQISAIGASLEAFGARFLGRIFSPAEAAYATQSLPLAPQRLAARFAAKEAAMKAFGWSDAGVAWREIEVTRAADGACALALHGSAARLAAEGGWTDICVSLSHDGDYATAVVAALAPR